MQSAPFENVILRQLSSILKLLSCEDDPLLIYGDTFLVLDFLLQYFYGAIEVCVIERYGFARSVSA